MATTNRFVKDSNEVLDYKFDFRANTNQSDTNLSDYLAAGETISSYTITEDTGITVDSDNLSDSDTSVTVWLSGGTTGIDYNVVCQIVTSSTPTRTVERTIVVQVRDK